MSRKPNTTKIGESWSQLTIILVWSKANTIIGQEPSKYRMDNCGSIMEFSKHGDRNSEFGWEIDHINPVANDGDDNLDNLQPLNWKNNLAKSDKLNWKCGE